MNWTTRGKATMCAPYRILSEVRGFSVWLFSKDKSGCLARELPTLRAAQAFAEAHKSRESA